MTDAAAHGQFEEALSAYALDALEAREARAFEAHLATCGQCQTELADLRRVAAAIGLAVEPVAPPDALKGRVLARAMAQPQHRARSTGSIAPVRTARAPWLAAAAAAAIAVGVGIYALSLRTQIQSLRQMVAEASTQARSLRDELADARRESGQLSGTVRVLSAPDMLRVDLRGQAPTPNATGRAFWSRSQGLVFKAIGLPRLDIARVYQLWMIKGNTPTSAGLLTVAADGSSSLLAPVAAGAEPPDAFGVTIEPAGGSEKPTPPIVMLGSATR